MADPLTVEESAETTMAKFQSRFSKLPVFEVSPQIAFQFTSGKDSTLARFTLKKGTKTPPTSHPSEQFTYVVEGALKYTVRDRKILLKQGDLILVPSLAQHHVDVLEDTVLLDFFSPAWPDLPRSVSASKKTEKSKKAR